MVEERASGRVVDLRLLDGSRRAGVCGSCGAPRPKLDSLAGKGNPKFLSDSAIFDNLQKLANLLILYQL